jgi:hypothetical protein
MGQMTIFVSFLENRQFMKVARPKAATATTAMPRGLFFAGLLAVILAALFWKSFLPGYVHFSNDGPLGQQNAAWLQLPGAFTGSWGDLNDIGGSAGATAPDMTALMRLALHPLGVEGPVLYAKFFPAVALFILGLGAWTFFRQLKLSPLAAVLGGLAAALNSAFFSTACWGVASQQIAVAMTYFALALVVSNTPETPALTRWVRWALAGLAVGANVMQGADIGAIFSVFIAAFVLFKTLVDESGPVLARLAHGVGRVVLVAVFAGFIAVQTILALVGSSITGVAGTGQDAETKARQWNWATQWSFPKIESLNLFIPGLFGYRMDTPKNMMESLQDSYKGGNYWGAVGRDVAWDRFFAGGKQGSAPDANLHYLRFSGGGCYAGILVALLAAWAIAQSLRRQNSVFDEKQRRMLWFWTALLIGSLLLSWGRFAPFYAVLYKLPYASLIRNPTKFLLIFSWALVIIFAYGVHGLSRRYLEVPAGGANSPLAQLKNWWAKVRGFDRHWTLACVFAVAVSILAWLIYASQKANLVSHLQDVGFPDKGYAATIATFSIGQVGWFVPFFALAVGLCTLVIAGVFAGKRAKLGGILLGVLLIVDLGRANLPWVVHWDYKQKYASNPILDFLRDKPYEHRVAGLRSGSLFEELYQIEWKQHQFPYYNIQCLDIVQSPRVASDLEAYDTAVTSRPDRYWQLTNTRYLLGPAAYLDSLNQQLDPVQKRFSIVARFNLVPKPGVSIPEGYSPEQFVNYLPLEEITAQPSSEGPYALFEYSAALPRAKLYSNWQLPVNDKAAASVLTLTNLGAGGWAFLQQVGTNDFLTLNELVSSAFDPGQTVLLADSPAVPNPPATTANANSGTVEYTGYTPKDIKLHTQAATPTVLLLNDKFDPHWRVFVDGKPAPLLRCNFIMRGVYLTEGEHQVEFYFGLPTRPLYVTLSAIVLGILLCGFLYRLEHKPQTPKK